jgi:hypothetical protein
MTRATLIHLEEWLSRQFPHLVPADSDLQAIKAAMMRQYTSDPEFYDRVGWWRCYDAEENAR